MMLITSFGASIGGMGTPVGTPPNLIGIGMLEKLAGVNVTFFPWMAIGVPVVLVLFAYLVAAVLLLVGARAAVAAGSTTLVRAGAGAAGAA